jgi:hypothetical protein
MFSVPYLCENNYINCVKEGFVISIGVPSSSTIFECMKKVHSTASFLDKKYTRENAVLTEEKLDEIGAGLEHLPCKSFTQLAQQAQVCYLNSMIVTETLHVLLFKIRQKLRMVIIRKHIFETGFCGQPMIVSLTRNFFYW